VSVDIFSDTIYPWCYIGFNQLNQALENFNNYNFDIVWRPFQLNSEMPSEGIDRQQYLTAKFRGEDNARSVYQRIEDIGSVDVLIRLSKDADIYDEHIEKYLISKEDNNSLLSEEKQAKNIGINSIPCFIFYKEIVVNGAQPTKNFIQIINSLNNNV
jgi:predicted DsbA family dithiol-disulfide isomerase